MRDKLKRFLSLLLAFVMVLSIVPVSAEDSNVVVDETSTTEGSVGETVPVAKIGEDTYPSLEAAFVAAPTGEETTITLLRDVEEVVRLSVSDTEVKRIVLDLNDKTWDCGYGTRINAVNLKITNGTIGTSRWSEGFDGDIDVFYFGGHAKLPSTMALTGVTFNAELRVNNMAPSDEELNLLKSTARSTGKAPNATTVIIEDGQFDVVTVQKAAYLTINGGFFSGINAEEGAIVDDNRNKGEGSDDSADSEESKEIVTKKEVYIKTLDELGYTRTESGVTITFVDYTPVAERDYMQFTVGATSTTFTVQEQTADGWKNVEPESGKSTIKRTFTEPATVTYRLDWDNNGTFDRLIVLMKAPVAKISKLMSASRDETDYVAQDSVKPYTSLLDALKEAQDGDTVTLLADVELNTRLIFSLYTEGRKVTLDGGDGFKLYASSTNWGTGNGKHLINVNCDNVTLRNIVLDCNSIAEGVNIYKAQNIVFDNVEIINKKGWNADLTVNGSTLTVKNKLSASYVDVDLGSGVTTPLGIVAEEGTVLLVRTLMIDSAAYPNTNLDLALAEDNTSYYTFKKVDTNGVLAGYSNSISRLSNGYGYVVLEDATVSSNLTLLNAGHTGTYRHLGYPELYPDRG